MADLLTKICSKYGCDKSDRRHKYTPKYHRHFKNIRNQDFAMLEFGFGQGKSVKMWLEYFPNATIYNVDLRKTLPKEKIFRSKRFKFISANQIDKDKILSVIKKERKFQIIIDDASHVAEDQQYTMSFMFPYLANTGHYVIEDLKCPRTPNKSFKCEADKTLKFLKDYLKTGHFKSKILNHVDNNYLSEAVESVEIYDKIAFIRKRGVYGY